MIPSFLLLGLLITVDPPVGTDLGKIPPIDLFPYCMGTNCPTKPGRLQISETNNFTYLSWTKPNTNVWTEIWRIGYSECIEQWMGYKLIATTPESHFVDVENWIANLGLAEIVNWTKTGDIFSVGVIGPPGRAYRLISTSDFKTFEDPDPIATGILQEYRFTIQGTGKFWFLANENQVHEYSYALRTIDYGTNTPPSQILFPGKGERYNLTDAVRGNSSDWIYSYPIVMPPMP